MNRWTMLRDNLVNALRALPLPDGVVVEPIVRPAGVWAIVGPSAIGVALISDRWLGPSEVDNHVNQPGAVVAQIVVRGDSARDTVESIHDINEIARIALRVRNTDIGIYGTGDDELDTGGVFLDGMRSDFLEFTGREPGGAGPLAKVFTLQSTALPL